MSTMCTGIAMCDIQYVAQLIRDKFAKQQLAMLTAVTAATVDALSQASFNLQITIAQAYIASHLKTV